MSQRIKQIETKEDWYPTGNGEVRKSIELKRDKGWRVTVRGDGVYMIYKDFPPEAYEEAKDLWIMLVDNTPQKMMLELYGMKEYGRPK